MDDKTKIAIDACGDLEYYESQIRNIGTKFLKNGIRIPRPLLDAITGIRLARKELEEKYKEA